MADEGSLPVVVEVGVGNGDIVNSVSNIEKTIIVVLVVVLVGAQVEVVNPDITGRLDGNRISANDLGDGQVANDDILDILNSEREARELGSRALSNDGLVGSDLDVASGCNSSRDDNDFGSVTSNSGGELREGGNGSCSATNASSSS